MDRKEFLKSLGLSASALMAIYCMGGVTGCSNKSNDPAPNNNNNGGNNNGGNGNNGNTKIDFTIELNDKNFAVLQNNDTSVYKDSIIIIRKTTGDFVALAKSCTHQGSNLDYDKDNKRLHCSNHGSNFSFAGEVLNGPASISLKVYKTTFDSVKNTLRVFED